MTLRLPTYTKRILMFISAILCVAMILPKTKSPVKQSTQLLEEYMQEVVVNNFTPQGKLKNTIQASFWAYVPSTQQSLLQNPHLTLYKTNGLVWSIKALFAEAQHPTLTSEVTEVTLKKDVVIIRNPNRDSQITVMTNALTYDPDTTKVSSKEHVTLLTNNLKITGTGMHGILDDSKIELEKEVETFYEAK